MRQLGSPQKIVIVDVHVLVAVDAFEVLAPLGARNGKASGSAGVIFAFVREIR